MALIPPSDKHQEAIKQLYFYKDPATLEEDIDALIEWLSKQPHLPNVEGLWIIHRRYTWCYTVNVIKALYFSF